MNNNNTKSSIAADRLPQYDCPGIKPLVDRRKQTLNTMKNCSFMRWKLLKLFDSIMHVPMDINLEKSVLAELINITNLF